MAIIRERLPLRIYSSLHVDWNPKRSYVIHIYHQRCWGKRKKLRTYYMIWTIYHTVGVLDLVGWPPTTRKEHGERVGDSYCYYESMEEIPLLKRSIGFII